MKNFIVLKGWHYCCNFLPKFRFITKDKLKKEYITFGSSVMFTEDSRYIVDETSAVNKLFGVCYGINGVHRNSDRLGWVYNPKTKDYSIILYSYSNGILFKRVIDTIKENELVDYSVSVDFIDGTSFRKVTVYKNQKFFDESLYTNGYTSFNILVTLGLYFGGKLPAPKTIKVKLLQL